MEPTELSLLTKVKIVGSMTLFGVLIVAITGGIVSYQRNAKIEAAELAKTQLVNLEAMRTVFPSFRDTKQFKESATMAIVKVPIASLPTTIEAGLMETAPVNPAFGNPQCVMPPFIDPGWSVVKIGEFSDTIVAVNDDLTWGAVDGWLVTEDGQITIPDTASYGKYMAVWASADGECMREGEETGVLQYFYEFKITPPCPTGVTIGISAIPKP